MAAANDKKTLQLIEQIKKQKAEIAKLDRPTWNTNCAFAYVEGSSATVNIQVVSSIRDLVLIAAFLVEKQASYEKAAKLLGVEAPPPFTWSNFTVADWIDDLKLRICKIQVATKRKKLESMEARLAAVISPELKAEMELQAITEELGQ